MSKDFLHLSDYTKNELFEIFKLADQLDTMISSKPLCGKTIILFFPESSIRTRVTFEKGIHELGGETILFPPEALDKKESLGDVTGYLANWADGIVVRHNSLELVEELAEVSKIPVINAMTKENHPCEILTDLYSLSKVRDDFMKDRFLFVGARGNIGNTWKEASDIFKFEFTHCCPNGYEIDGAAVCYDLSEGIRDKDIICTDSIPTDAKKDFKEYQVTKALMEKTNAGAVINPCPPFYRGEEVSADIIDSEYFVGYEFKKNLLRVQQAVLLYLLDASETDYSDIIGKEVSGTIDRPLGSPHPRHPEMIYPINYGYVDGIIAGDGAEQDVYVFGTDEPIKTFKGKVIAVYHRFNDVEDKWIVSLDGSDIPDNKIMGDINFQEQFFRGRLYK